jgi:NAD-dependent DNA ligase
MTLSLSRPEAKAELESLAKKIAYHDHCYYHLSKPEISDEAYERMNSLVSQSDYNNYIKSASKMMSDLTDDGFEARDVFYWLYTRLTAEV